MSCRHDLALGTCSECYPQTGTIAPTKPGDSLDGPGAVSSHEAHIKALENLYEVLKSNKKELDTFIKTWEGRRAVGQFYDVAAKNLAQRLGDNIEKAVAAVDATQPASTPEAG